MGRRRRNGQDTKAQDKRGRSSSPLFSSRRHKSRPRSSTVQDDPSIYDDTYLPNSRTSQYLDPDEAFRESLFDALADDEGAEYWEGVYGQPIHTYPKTKTGASGELEEMTEEEYTTYVRNRMWEKSHQHLLEERSRREQARLKQREHQQNSDRKRFDILVDEALRSGDQRRKERAWKSAWDTYSLKWSRLLEAAGTEPFEGISRISSTIPWPVETGCRRDVSKDTIREFFQHHPEEPLAVILKMERIRWHPDKMQQRFGGSKIDPEVLQSITAVFQIVDSMWATLKKSS
jgi:hypothetical protein